MLSCEDVPCRKNMVNPTLGIGFYKTKSNNVSDTLMYAQINIVDVNGNFLSGDDYYTQNLRLPLFTDNNHLNLKINYSSVFYKVDTFKTEQTIIYDTLSIIDTLPYVSFSGIDTIQILDSICWIDSIENVETCLDTMLYVVEVLFIDTISIIDTTYLNSFDQEFEVYYSPKLVAISPECGFGYEYAIDSVRTKSGKYIKSLEIMVEKVEIPEDIYNEEPINININF